MVQIMGTGSQDVCSVILSLVLLNMWVGEGAVVQQWLQLVPADMASVAVAQAASSRTF